MRMLFLVKLKKDESLFSKSFVNGPCTKVPDLNISLILLELFINSWFGEFNKFYNLIIFLDFKFSEKFLVSKIILDFFNNKFLFK